jgi:hypothetical protein
MMKIFSYKQNDVKGHDSYDHQFVPDKLINLFIWFVLIACFSCNNADTPEDILSRHPRILLFEGEEEIIKESVEANPVWKKMHEAIVNESDAMIKLAPLERELTGRRLLSVSREALRRIFYLSYSYRLTGEEKYFQRAEIEMLAVADFSDWNPAHFLDVGEMTMAVAIGYDWLFHKLSSGSREIIREAIVKKGIEPSFDPDYNWFLEAEHNWNQVCNAGMTYGAIAIYEDYPELAKEVIDRAYNTITLAKADYEPDGAYPEGFGYWKYGTSFNVMFLSAVDKIWPGRFNYEDFPAFVKTGSFVKNMLASSGISYNWGDNSAGGSLSPAMFWFAERNNQPSLLWKEKIFLDRDDYNRFTNDRLLPGVMIWGKDIPFNDITEPDSKIYVAGGKMPLVLMRTSWTDPGAIYLGFKGGSPSVNHGHMDVGSFVFEADGVRWAIDLGAQGYHSLESLGMNIWGRTQDAERWTVYRLNNYSHSTLTVNGELQRVDGYAKIDRYSDDPGFSYGISDISSLYSTTLESVTRGAGIVDQEYVIIRDELSTGHDPAVIRWQMLTGAVVQVTGNNSATLTFDGKTLQLRVDSPENVNVTTWSSQPGTEWDVENPGTILVGFEVTVPANSREALDVKFIPGSSNTDAAFNRKLEEW